MKRGEIRFEVDLTFEKRDSELVPWGLIDDNSIVPEDYRGSWENDLGLMETGIWELPVEANLAIASGDQLFIQGTVLIEFYKEWTDCGWEYDAILTWESYETRIVREEE